ncbi:unnamed protein product [Adineta steineri]|uniref:Uncharacterized protein n=1 Tax=Adineta steineri TaxID=433720 RepID=A0A813XZI7_9BILA|nr:unnamed protein product [Adineta steineri]
MVDRFKAQARIMRDMRQLMKEIQNEMSYYKQMGADFVRISQDFHNEVCKFRREANKLYQHVEEVNIQLDLLIEMFVDYDRPFNDNSTQDNVNLCVQILQELAGMERFNEDAAQTFQNVSQEITEFQDNRVEPARIKAVKREQRLRMIKDTTIAGTTGLVAGGSISGGLVASPILGGAGAFVLGTTVFPPAAIIVGSIAVGLLAMGAIGWTISKLLRNYRAYSSAVAQNLEKLSTLCDQMKQEASFMKEKSDDLAVRIQDFSASMRGFRYGSLSDRQRRAHSEICRKSKERNLALMQTLREIIDFKILSLAQISTLLPNRSQRTIRE